MIGFGSTNPFPLRFGGGRSSIEDEHQALLDAFAPGWDRSDETANAAEAYALALAISFAWVAARRVANQLQPLKMLEHLTVWEEASRLRPLRSDADITRRTRLAAQMRGLAGNTIGDITDACAALLGDHFVTTDWASPDNEIAYWPGVYPGPPGYEWSTNRVRLRVVVQKLGLAESEFYTLMASLERLLDAMLPAWMAYAWRIDGGFIVGESGVGQVGV